MKKRKIVVVTGTRAEFGIWGSVLRAMKASKKIELQLVVTGMHLQREFGWTVKDVEGAAFGIAARVGMYGKGRSASENLAVGVKGWGRAFRKLKPEMVMVLGDRLEMLAAGCAAVAERIAIGHVHGGETAPGQWDEQIRHALTKMAHVHFCATEKARGRILRMGEEEGRVFKVGAPGLDGISRWLAESRQIDKRGRWAILLLHPTSSDDRVEERRARMVVGALKKVMEAWGVEFCCVIGPNNDPGHEGIVRAYKEIWGDVSMSLSAEEFWKKMKYAGVLVGNSSSGIIEAASFGIPVVNIGDRQKGRERNGNVIDVSWEEGREGIEGAVVRALTDRGFLRRVARRENLYGDGRAAERIVRVLEGMEWPVGIVKGFRD
ncbi:MAG: UDP-N-acetylglucosamine 2-epimerase [Phycisphaerae bacterium]